jgi:hypothetical protein
MATLVALDQDRKFVLNVRSAEPGADKPRWLRCEVSMIGDGSQGTQQVSLTGHDVAELASRLAGLSSDHLRFQGTDETLIVELGPADRAGMLFFSAWVGEPYVVMTGWRFPVTAAHVMEFGDALLRESSVGAAG